VRCSCSVWASHSATSRRTETPTRQDSPLSSSTCAPRTVRGTHCNHGVHQLDKLRLNADLDESI
jgi:hypothetical protein